MNCIEELYYGNIEAQELNTGNTPKLKKKLGELVRKEEVLIMKLSDEDKELFSDYVKTYNEFSCLGNTDSFISGFRLGARLTYDTFVER